MNKLIVAVLLAVFLAAPVVAEDVDSLVVAGNKFWSEGKLAQAESTFREAIELDPGTALRWRIVPSATTTGRRC